MALFPESVNKFFINLAKLIAGFGLVVAGFIILIALTLYDVTAVGFTAVVAEFFRNSVGTIAGFVIICYLLKAGFVLLFEREIRQVQMPIMMSILSVMLFSFSVGFISNGANGGVLGAVANYDLGQVIMPALKFVGFGLFVVAGWMFVSVMGIKYSHLVAVASIISGLFHKKTVQPVFDLADALPAEIAEPKVKKSIFTRVPRAKKEAEVKAAPAPLNRRTAAPKAKENNYRLPDVRLLEKGEFTGRPPITPAIKQAGTALKDHFEEFGVEGDVVGIKPGPIVTLYEFKPGRGVKTTKVIETVKDITRVMQSENIRMAHIPGTDVIGVELPNVSRQNIRLQGIMANTKFTHSDMAIPIALGVNIGGDPVYTDLAKMPHLMISGRTGTGKSIFMGSIILSLLYRFRPDECKMIMIDPKGVEFSLWENIPHLLTPVVALDAMKAVKTLKWTVQEMENRYLRLRKFGVQNIGDYNKQVAKMRESDEVKTEQVQIGVDSETGAPIFETRSVDLSNMPYIIVIVDEVADLMQTGGKEIDACLQRLAQKARAAGIHVVIATQRPDKTVITGTIKANFPTRVSFAVPTATDSIIALGRGGAEQLLPRGDMLFAADGKQPARIHTAFISNEEYHAVADAIRAQAEPEFVPGVGEEEEGSAMPIPGMKPSKDDKDADLYTQAVDAVRRDKKPSISYVQRVLRVGYNKAATFIERMEREGIVSAPDATGKRIIL
jgi:S-DNA-T family DNA segregation ATPase FtsK/SpoIIIE